MQRTGTRFVGVIPSKDPVKVATFCGMPIVCSPDMPPHVIRVIDGSECLVEISLAKAVDR